jgi:hypothetical protein
MLEHDGTWWKCTCGKYLPDAPENPPSYTGLVTCSCGASYEFNYWSLNRWPRDGGSTGLEPRLSYPARETRAPA